MRLTLTTQPQAIDLTGEQGDFVLYNEGPDTIYLDTNGSVGSALSIPLAPLTYLPWRYQVPLWAVSRGLSTLFSVPAMDAPTLNGSPRQQVIAKESGSASSSTGATVVSLAECAAYQSLIVSYACNLTFDVGNQIVWAVDWYDSDDNFLERTRGIVHPPRRTATALSSGFISRLYFPVKGSKFTLRVLSASADFSYDLSVTGDTNSRSYLLSPSFDSSASSPPDYPAVPVAFTSSGTIDGWSEDWAAVTHVNGTWSSFAFKPLGRTLRLLFDFGASTNPTALGRFAIFSPFGARVIMVQTLATATQFQEFTITRLPLSIPLYFFWLANPTTTLSPAMQMFWSD